MANFPTSVFNPSARSNGQTIDGSHVNDLQDEVTAIEDGYRNATAPLNSSNSTLANLTVTGGSTFASIQVTGGSTFGAMTLGASTLASLSVAGNSTLAAVQAGASTLASLSVTGNSTLAAVQAGASTLASVSIAGGSTLGTVQAGASTLASLSVAGGSTLGTVQVGGASTFTVRPIMPLPDAGQFALAAALNLTADTTLAIPWVVETFLTNSSAHSTAVNPSLIRPQSTGVYVFAADAVLSGALTASTGEYRLEMKDSSGAVLARDYCVGVTENVLHVYTIKRFDAVGSEVRVVAKVRDGSTHSIRVATSNLSFHKLL